MSSTAITTTPLNNLLSAFSPVQEIPPIGVSGLSLDSRKVKSGDAYIALQGIQVHGIDYVADAIANGAQVVLVDADDQKSIARKKHISIPLIAIPDLGVHLGEIAAQFYASPSTKMSVCGVTGTDGKTSVCRFVCEALTQLGYKVGYIGTIGWGLGNALESNPLTTPDCITLQSMMSAFCHNGAEFVILEVSSHALVQGRVNGVAFDIAVLTNFGRDHLDFHGNLSAYRAAKSKLFSWPGLSALVVNIGDQLGLEIASHYASKLPVAGFDSTDSGAAENLHLQPRLVAEEIQVNEKGLKFRLVENNLNFTVQSALLGRFNVDNLLSCYAIMRAFGIDAEKASAQLSDINPVPGRMERFGYSGQGNFVVDFAHTPQALQAALQTLRSHCSGRLWVVFGCGGDRDPGKRKLMGEVAAQYADQIVVTDDNPRTEPSADIIGHILEGIPLSKNPTVIADREAALQHVIGNANANDWVLIAGKGHENYQIVGSEYRDFSDRETLRRLTSAQVNDPGAGGTAS